MFTCDRQQAQFTKISPTGQNMKSVIVFVLMLTVQLSNSQAYQLSCNYINNQTDSVQLNCEFGGFLYPGATAYTPFGCFYDLFKSKNQTDNRKKVTKLKITDSTCTLVDHDLNELFDNVQDFEYTFTQSSILPLNFQFKNCKKFNASHNELMIISVWNFREKPNLVEVDLSHNEILDVVGITFAHNDKLVTIDLSHNSLSDLGEDAFFKLTKLETVDLSSNKIVRINKNAFQSNINLRTIRLENNAIKMFDCHTFLPLKNVASISLSLASVDQFNFNCPKSSLFVEANDSTQTFIHQTGGGIEVHCSAKDFQHLRFFYVAESQLQNISRILERLPLTLEAIDLSSINLSKVDVTVFERFANLEYFRINNASLTTLEPVMFSKKLRLKTLDISNNDLSGVDFKPVFKQLNNLQHLFMSNCNVRNVEDALQSLTPSIAHIDLSFNFVGKLSAGTFQQFTNLIHLNLSHTELFNFGFETFYHQTKLVTFDISYNNLGSVDFSLFVRCFNHLRLMNLEGNNLTEISTMSPSNFPHMSQLRISNNDFPCYYLAALLKVWQHVHFFHNPSFNRTHMNGIDCDINKKPVLSTTTIANDKQAQVPHVIVVHSEPHVVKYSLIFLCIMCCGYLLVKSKIIHRLRATVPRNPLGDSLGSQPATSTFTLITADN